MLGIEPGRSIPAFRAGLLSVYRWLVPSWIVLLAIWAAWRSAFPQPFQHSTMRWLAPLSTVQILVRFAGLESGSQGLNVGWILMWYILSTAQNTLLVSLTQRRFTKRVSSSHRCYIALGPLLAVLVLQSTASVTDFVAGPSSRGPSYVNILFGSLAVAYLVACCIQLLRHTWPPTSEWPYQTSLKSVNVAFAASLLIIAILFGSVTAVNLWAATMSLPPAEFAHRFLSSRYWLIDAPKEWIFLLWTFCLAPYSEWVDTHELEEEQQHYTTDVEEMQYLQESVVTRDP